MVEILTNMLEALDPTSSTKTIKGRKDGLFWCDVDIKDVLSYLRSSVYF